MGVEGLFGLVNDSIRSLATEVREHEAWEFFCECPNLGCNTLVSLTITEFDQLRTSVPQIPILATHEA